MYRFNIVNPIYFDKFLKFTIEHGHNNVLILDLRSVAYWYHSQADRVAAIKPKKEREPMPLINPVDIHKWRDAWRNQKGMERNCGEMKIELFLGLRLRLNYKKNSYTINRPILCRAISFIHLLFTLFQATQFLLYFLIKNRLGYLFPNISG